MLLTGNNNTKPESNNRIIPKIINILFRVSLIIMNITNNAAIKPANIPSGPGRPIPASTEITIKNEITPRNIRFFELVWLGVFVILEVSFGGGVDSGEGCRLSKFVGEPHFPQNLTWSFNSSPQFTQNKYLYDNAVSDKFIV